MCTQLNTVVKLIKHDCLLVCKRIFKPRFSLFSSSNISFEHSCDLDSALIYYIYDITINYNIHSMSQFVWLLRDHCMDKKRNPMSILKTKSKELILKMKTKKAIIREK